MHSGHKPHSSFVVSRVKKMPSHCHDNKTYHHTSTHSFVRISPRKLCFLNKLSPSCRPINQNAGRPDPQSCDKPRASFTYFNPLHIHSLVVLTSNLLVEHAVVTHYRRNFHWICISAISFFLYMHASRTLPPLHFLLLFFLTKIITHSLTHPLTHPLNQSIARSPTHSPITTNHISPSLQTLTNKPRTMPLYLLYGFKWPRPAIRAHVFLQDLDDASPDQLQGKRIPISLLLFQCHSHANKDVVVPLCQMVMVNNLLELHEDLAPHLQNLELIEQNNCLIMGGDLCKMWAFVAAKVIPFEGHGEVPEPLSEQVSAETTEAVKGSFGTEWSQRPKRNGTWSENNDPTRTCFLCLAGRGRGGGVRRVRGSTRGPRKRKERSLWRG